MPLRLKLEDSDEQILAGKKALADALIQVGITAVEPNPNRPDSYETFQSYADKIKRLMISNSFILEYQIPEEGFEKLTKYKRTVFLPVSGASINRVTKAIIDSDTGYTPSNTISTLTTNKNANYGLEYATIDVFGNIVSDGSIEIEESEESKNYRVGQEFAERHANEPMALALEDDYSFSVDWGDGSPICEFVDFDSTPEAWYHTYEQPGTYDVTINGIFRVPYSWPDWNGKLILDGEFIYDRDGVAVRDLINYSTQYYLIKVIAWGNTRFRSLRCALANTRVLQSIPIIDTTKSFEDVESCESFCYNGIVLSTLPYDSNTKRGMFTNMPIVRNMARCFQSCNFTSEIPEKIIENCPELTSIYYMFGNCSMTGKFPASMLSGLGKLTDISYCFYSNKFTEGTLPSTFLDECPNIIDAYGTFYGASISGELPSGFFKNQSKLTKAYSIFYASDLTSLGKDALSGLTADKLMLNGAFIQTHKLRCDIPEGFFTHLTGDKVWATQMFYNSYVNSVPSTLFDEISHFENCCEMFSQCVLLTSSCPSFPSNGDFDNYETIQKYFGFFVRSENMADFDTIPAELGGNGERLFPKYNVGKICLDDGTFVEINDFVYDTNNKPIGFCFHSDDNVNKVMAWNEFYGTITNSASTLTQFFYPYDEIPWQYTFPILGSNPLSSDAWNYIPEKTSAEYTQDLFNWQKYKDNRDALDGYRFIEEYKVGEHNNYFWHIPDIHEAMEMSMLYMWMYKAVLKLQNSTNGDYNTSNCYNTRVSFSTCNVNSDSHCYVSTNNQATINYNGLIINLQSVRPIIDVPQR